MGAIAVGIANRPGGDFGGRVAGMFKVARSEILLRGLRNRCPNCGGKSLFAGAFRLHQECPRCGLPLERGEGFFLGSMSINYGVTIAVWLVPMLILGWTGMLPAPWAIGLALAGGALFPVLFYRSSRSLWLMAFYFFLPHELPANRRKLAEGEDENV